MSSGATPNVEIDALSRAVEQVERKTVALRQAIDRGRNVRLCVLVAIVALIGGVCFMFWTLFKQIQGEEYRKKVTDIIITKFLDRDEPVTEEELYDLLFAESDKLRESAYPVLSKAFSDQIEKDMPRYSEAVLKERDILAKNLQSRLQERLETHLKVVVNRHQEILREEFPEITDKQLHTRMRNNFESIMTELVDEYYVDELGKQMQAVYQNYEDFPVAGPLEPGEDRVQLLLGALMDLLTIRLAGRETTAAETEL